MNYKIAEKMRYNKKQTMLSDKGCIPNDKKYAQEQYDLKFDSMCLCPFCLETNYFSGFKNNGGYVECPNCKNLMMIKTLCNILKFTNREFGKWAFDYRLSGFWDKVYPSFKIWNEKLHKSGISYEFWEEYKKLKGVSTQQENDDEEY